MTTAAATTLEAGLTALARSGIDLPAEAAEALERYLALLAKWNRTYNLTAIRDPERMVTHHVLDALSILPHLPQRPGQRILDIGSGGGVPGIPLALARSEWRVTLLDSNHKKGAFLSQAVAELDLRNAQVAVERAESYRPAAPFDVVVSRAFSDLDTFVAAGLRQLAPGGHLVAMKGVFPHEELAQLPASVRVVALPALRVPGVDAERHLVVMAAT